MPLQREFKGLADHTGLYQAGKLPIELSAALSPVISAEDFVNPPEIVRWSGTLNGLGQLASAPVVPEGEMHRVRWIGGEASQAVGATSQIHPVIFHLDGFFGVRPFQSVNMFAGSDQSDGIYFGDMPLLLLPGMGVSWYMASYAGAGNVIVRGLYQYQSIGI